MKNHIIICFAILLAVSLFALASVAEGIEEEVYYIGDYAYSYKEDGTIKIVNALCGRRDEMKEYLIDYSEDAMNYIPSSINGIPVTEIGDEVFSSLYISSWTVPGTIKKIGNRAFANSEVETVILEEGVEELGDYVFKSMYINKIIIPSTLAKMGENPFRACFIGNGFSSIELSPENEHFWFQDGIFYDIEEARLVSCLFEYEAECYQIPDGTKTIDAYAFDSSGIHQILIPDSVIDIGEYAFAFCDFQSISLPPNLKAIKDGTFECCGELQTISIPSSVTEFGENIFLRCDQVRLLVEKSSAAEKYARENGLKYQLKKE